MKLLHSFLLFYLVEYKAISKEDNNILYITFYINYIVLYWLLVFTTKWKMILLIASLSLSYNIIYKVEAGAADLPLPSRTLGRQECDSG